MSDPGTVIDDMDERLALKQTSLEEDKLIATAGQGQDVISAAQ